jgi:2'-5' RNA ligase
MRPCLFAIALLAIALAATPSVAQSSKQGSLFSAILCADTSFGNEWARLLPTAQARFPGLKLTRVADLHVTVVYVGPRWQPDELDRLRPLALTGPTTPTNFTPEIVALGANHEVVVVELHAPSPAWGEAVTSAKAELNRLGLKQPDRYDADFRPHLTLAQAPHRPASAADSAELAAFLAWMQTELARDPQQFSITLGPATPVRFLLAGTPRPADAPEYVTVEEFLNPTPLY